MIWHDKNGILLLGLPPPNPQPQSHHEKKIPDKSQYRGTYYWLIPNEPPSKLPRSSTRQVWETATTKKDMNTKKKKCGILIGFPCGSVVKNPPANSGDTGDAGLISVSGKIPWKRKWQPTPVFLLGKSHRQRSLAGYSLRGRK